MNYWVKDSPNPLTLGASVSPSLIRGRCGKHLFFLLSFHSSLFLGSCCFPRFGPHCSDGSNLVQSLLSRDVHVTQPSQLIATSSSAHCGWVESIGNPGWMNQKSTSGLCLELLRRNLLFNKVPKLSRMELWRNLHTSSSRDGTSMEESRSSRYLDLLLPFQIFDQ